MSVRIAGLAERVRPLAMRSMRGLPKIRGRGRVAALLNRALLSAGADPIMICDMAAGHRMRIDCRIFSHCHVAFSGSYDDGKISALTSFLRPGDVALDVGANVGFYSVPIALAAKKIGARVVAVEPFPNNIDWLRENLCLNGAEDTVRVLPVALSDHAGTLPLVLAEDFVTGANVGNAALDSDDLYDQSFRRVSVPVETLDDLWKDVGQSRPLRIVKIDIEGREAQFLEGARSTISNQRPVIMMEVNRWFYEQRGLDFDTLIPSLLPSGYRPAELRAGKLIAVRGIGQCSDRDVFLVPDELSGRLQADRD